MAVKIRMTRMGRRHRPFFRINAIDSRTPRDGRILEKLGHYDPLEKDKEKQVVLKVERIKHWLDNGAVPSDTIADLLAKHGIMTKAAEQRAARREKAKAQAIAKDKPFDKAARIAVQKAAKAAEEAAKKAEEEAKAAAEAAKKAEEEAAKAAEEAAAEAPAEDAPADKAPAEEKPAE